mmetsp:Transcript_16744/g.41123  ORF Transcript_16744/g.41123 Transcript_16744/m.41123 type:complete len:164 (+) Transcript_16744:2-493(+)
MRSILAQQSVTAAQKATLEEQVAVLQDVSARERADRLSERQAWERKVETASVVANLSLPGTARSARTELVASKLNSPRAGGPLPIMEEPAGDLPEEGERYRGSTDRASPEQTITITSVDGTMVTCQGEAGKKFRLAISHLQRNFKKVAAAEAPQTNGAYTWWS